MQNSNSQNIQINIYSSESAYPTKYDLKNGETVVAGSGDSCGIKLSGGGVSQFHCMFELVDGSVTIHDCDTGGKTLVNGKSIESEVVCGFSDSISIGQHEIVLAPAVEINPIEFPDSSDDERQNERSPETEICTDELADVPQTEEDFDLQKNRISKSDDSDTPNESRLDNEFEQSVDQSSDFDESFQEAEDDDSWFESDEEPCGFEMDELLKDEMELLRSEIEFLQSEVAAKDQEIAEFTLGNAQVEPANSSDTEKLVLRLEELLEELDSSDERVKSLEDLLLLSEEANRAEQEERRQIEAWLGEIEDRVAQRELELEAEIGGLKERAAAAEKRQQKAESQLRKVLSKSKTEDKKQEVSSEQVLKFQQQIEQMERLLETGNEEKLVLHQQISELQRASESAVDVESLEQKLIQMELETSRERAAIARDRAELQAKLDEIERSEKTMPTLDSDYRFAAMRDHLREIHEEEKLDQIQKQQNSLSGRISRLLKRK